jgi:uncharacterized protein YbaP (TraB family)
MLLRSVLFAFLVFAAPAFAQAPDCGGVDISADPSIHPDWAAHADDLVNGEGLLWRIEKPGVAPSYLYGTMHSTREGPMRLARAAAPYADKATAVATELGDLDSAAKIEIGARMLREALSPDADTWVGEIEGADVAPVEALLSEKGTPKEMAHHLKLWMLALAASLPKCEVDGQAEELPEVDESFAKIAQANHTPVIALETIDEQMSAVASISAPLAAMTLKSAARGGALADGGYATLLSLYVQKKPTAALVVLEAAPGVSDEERKVTAELTRRLLGDRNDVMAARAAPLLEKGGAFVAVGALHLSGKRGLVELLRGRGWKVTNVW